MNEPPSASERAFDPELDKWVRYELDEGEVIQGFVFRKPQPRARWGTFLFLGTKNGVLAIAATAGRGHTVLERELAKVRPGDYVTIEFAGWRETLDGERSYRDYHLNAQERAPHEEPKRGAAHRVALGWLYGGAEKLR